MIPKIVHQTAPSLKNKWHNIWESCRNSWTTAFPQEKYKHYLWTDEDNLSLVEEHYPQYLTLYTDFPYNIMRVDFIRFCYMHKFGGIYADMDFYCYKNFYSTLYSNKIHIVESWYEWGEKVQNSLFSSPPYLNFWVDCMEMCKDVFYSKSNINYKSYHYILKTSGPILLSNILDSKEYRDIKILKKEYFNPKVKNQFSHIFEKTSNVYYNTYKNFEYLSQNEKTVFTRHFLTGNW